MALPLRRCHTWTLIAAIAAIGFALPLLAQTTPRPATRPAPTRTSAVTRPATPRTAAATPITPRSTAARPNTTRPAATPVTPVAKTNPLLPPPIAIDGFFGDLTLSPKIAPTAPAGFEPLLTAKEWQAYHDRFGADADNLTKLKTSGQIAFAQKLIEAAATGPEPSALSPGTCRFLLLRAAAIAFRSAGGFPTADKAVTAYLALMDKRSPAQVGALWSIANIMARTAVTPKPDRIRYDGIAAKANMQLALLMLDCDQIDAAQAIIKQVAYHEGWLKSDPVTRAKIAQVRTEVRQAGAMMDYLATQYQPAIHNDVPALTLIYLYGRYVKGNVALVADLPARVPDSTLAHLANSLDAAARGDVQAAFTAAENLRVVASAVPDAHIRARTLYAAMQLYDAFMAAPATERDRVQRTMARIAREGVVADGARKPGAIDPFAAPPAPATRPASPAMPAHPMTPARFAVAPAMASR